MSFWRRRGDDRIARELRAGRPEPPSELVDRLTGRLAAAPAPRQPRAWSRAAFAAALVTVMLGSFASFGGLSYAAAGTSDTIRTMTEIVVQRHRSTTPQESAAADQYETPSPPQVKSAVRKNTPSGGVAGAGRTATAGTLPFTGASLLATAGLGAILLGLGLVLRRRESRSSAS